MEDLKDAVADLDEKAALGIIRRRLKSGKDPEKILGEVKLGLRKVGERFERREYALIELEMANILFKECAAEVESLRPAAMKPKLEATELEALKADKRLAEAGEVE